MNQKTLEAMNACSASFLRFNFDAFTCYTAAKLFVDAYEREKHEQRHESQNNPYERHIEKTKVYDRLGVESCTGVNVNELQDAVKSSAQACKPEGRHLSQADTTGWSYAKSSAYERLQLLCNEKDNWSHNQNVICNAARRLAAACEREELEYPKNGEVYRDIFGNRYVVVTEEFLDGKHPRVGLIRVGTKGEAIFSEFLTPTLEDFMNPTFKKE